MARGKHKARSAGRRSAAQEATIAQLESELEAEVNALKAAEAALGRVASLKEDLHGEQAALANEAQDYASSLKAERDFLRGVYADARSHHSRVHAAWDHFGDAAMDLAPGSTPVEKIESFGRVLGMNAWIANGTRNLSTEQVTRIQRARGERTGASDLSHESRRLSNLVVLLNMAGLGPSMIANSFHEELVSRGVVERDAEGVHTIADRAKLDAEQVGLLDEAVALAERVWKARADDLDVPAVLVWGAGGIVSEPRDAGARRAALGYIDSASEAFATSSEFSTISLPLPSTSPAARGHYVTQGPTKMLTAWREVFDSRGRISKKLGLARHPFAQVNPHPQPGQALASQNMYARAAYSSWLNAETSAVRGQVAVGLTAAASYWLPAGQTAAFADSEPMNDSDRREMIMPYPQVFLAFAEPLIFEPTAAPVSGSADAERWKLVSAVAHDSLRGDLTVGEFISDRDISRGHESWLAVDIDSALEQFGAHIEGILLLSDDYGQPADLFAWCLAIPGAYGSPLGRFVIPASREATQYRDVVDNLTAVVAWAQWHEPDDSTDVPLGTPLSEVEAQISTADFRRDAKRSGAGIRVIDVGATNRGSKSSRRPAADDSDTAPMTPHFRRGHWRRQRFGRGLEESKRIRIAPVLVNAHRGGIAHRVYRLHPDRVSGVGHQPE
ncbi:MULTISPECIES: hypothetical protein [Microbacterium]|uniref:hypothetical protein n=1 Tax=Microbacterium TaxID=33882 RepID=UPI000D018B1B|nr:MULTISPECIES: hypothetical protein [Microbacterium]AVL98219.1 hypothetical protein C6C15_14550 [Microbacterium sp. str. 'China']